MSVLQRKGWNLVGNYHIVANTKIIIRSSFRANSFVAEIENKLQNNSQNKLQNDPQHLFYALYQITSENPVPLAHAGNFKQMTADWLNWAAEKGYIYA